jgi:ATP-dependent DNA helicase DinG
VTTEETAAATGAGTDAAVADALRRVAAALPAGEERPGQLQMAQAVAIAMRDREHLVVQAGTGTGKSLAYLVPAILLGEKVVVSTATKALQDQLAGKDLPFLAQHLGMPFEFAVLKGRSNYLCRQRAAEVQGGDGQLDLEDVDDDLRAGGIGKQILRLLEWGRTSPTGDRAELEFEPTPRAWANVSVSAMECPGALKCPRGEDCFAEAARKRAEEADVVVVNSHLYGAHLASGGHVLPLHDVVVFDEAHELEDIAATSLGLELGAGRFRALVRTMRAVVDPTDMPAVDHLDDAGTRLEAAIAPWRGKRLPQGLDAELSAVITGAAERVAAALSAVRKAKQGEIDGARKARALQAGGHLGGDLAMVADLPKTHVAWVEGPPHAPALKVAAVDVGTRLADALWGDVTGVLTSATIPPGLAERVGLPDDHSATIDVGSPFAFREQALLYCPAMPEPRSPKYEAALHAELRALMLAAGGRTLALFTSWRAMLAAADALAADVPWRILRQDALPKPALVRAFVEDEASCLFATMGFWQGVDVPGASCSVVAIDRIPFPRPDEPLTQARRDRAGDAAFRVVDLPRAATLLAQGAGRLIRTSTDRGVVAVLDSRLASAGYKRELLAALPPMKRTRTLAEVEAFLAPLR